ncbi:MAG: alpha-amylase family glycosyl hydrolase [Armatimonadetes bacterium]|nr:alpha-amylase family glycosyl hydrolase [Armatimonadota bacterium]
MEIVLFRSPVFVLGVGILLMTLGPISAALGAGSANPITIQNRYVELGFDRQTGAWIKLIDRRTGKNLIRAGNERLMAPGLWPPKLNKKLIDQAIARRHAITLPATWQFAPNPTGTGFASKLLHGDYQGLSWLPTPIPSRLGSGDDRLHNRIGVFWYRTEFQIPGDWKGKDLLLILGAVDDFDVTYVNGVEVGETGLGTPFNWETPRLYHVPARIIHTDRSNRLLVKVTNAAFDGGITAGHEVVALASALKEPLLQGPALSNYSIHQSNGRATLDLTAHYGTYRCTYRYTLSKNRPLFWRQLIVQNSAGSMQIIDGINCPTPPFQLGSNQQIIFPGTLPVGNNPLKKLKNGATLNARDQNPLAVLWDRDTNIGLGAWYDSEQEMANASVRRDGDGARISFYQNLIDSLKPADTVALSREYFWLSHGSRDAALAGVQMVYRRIGLHSPNLQYKHLDRKILYCGHPGGTPEMHFIGYGGFKALDKYLPTLKKMGISLFWMLPIWDHGLDPRWNLYAPFDQFKVSSLYGTPKQLQKLSSDAKKDGIRLIFDLVPHGPPDFTPLAKDHPQWICHNQDGSFHYEWGQVSFDYAQPGWQNYMRRVAAWDAKQYGAVGARVDCGNGSPPNWNPDVKYRPSFPTLGGGLEMNRAIRDGFLSVNHRAILLPEEYTGDNIYYRAADLTYDAQLYYLMMDLQDRNADPPEWAHSLGLFLHDQQLTLPPGAIKMRWVSNHDTVSWTFQKARPATIYGVPKLRALWALCAYIPGVPMLYQGDENPAIYGGKGVDNVDYLSRIYGLRNRTPALNRGSAHYDMLKATNGIFTCLRGYRMQQALVLISFNPDPITTELRMPAKLGGLWEDRLADQSIRLKDGSSLSMKPYQVRVLVRNEP